MVGVDFFEVFAERAGVQIFFHKKGGVHKIGEFGVFVCVCVFCLFTPFLSVFQRNNLILLHLITDILFF